MSKIPLIGESYALRSPAAAAQQTLNLIPQFIDDLDEQGKNKGILVGTPGYHQVASISGGVDIRGLWSGGGRCFAVAAVPSSTTNLYEIGQGSYVGGNPSSGAGTVSSAQALGSVNDDGLPAQIFGNGNQLLIVKNGYAWIDQGSGPVMARLLIQGTVNTSGTSVTWVSGDYFPSIMTGFITIDGINYLISSYNSTTSLTLTESAGTQTGATWQAPYGDPLTAVTGAYLDSYFIVQRPASQLRGIVSTSGTSVTWVSGNNFSSIVGGQQIQINSVPYTVSSVGSSTSLTLTGSAGTQSSVPFSATVQTITGTVNTTGNTVNWVSGGNFDEIVAGQQITIAGLLYTVASVVSANQLTITVTIGTTTGVTFTAALGSDIGRQFNISLPNDGSSWDPLDFAMKESHPDYIQSILADHEQLYLFGTQEGMEVWQVTGAATFPFQRIPGAEIPEGSVARYAPVAMAGKVFFMGGPPRGGPCAYRIDGFTPTRISTHAVEQAWASGIDTPSSAVAYAEEHDGHQFWVINFPSSLNTWVYDETASAQAGTPIWHQRAAWSGSSFGPYVPRFHTFIPEWGPNGMHIVGDFGSGKIHELNLNYFDDNASDKKWQRIFPHLYAAGKWQYFGRLTLEMETGSTSSVSVQPTITLDFSDDRGNTFANSQSPLTGGAGVNAAYAQRVFWPSIGASRDRVLRLAGAGQYRTTLIDLDCELEIGTT